MVGGDEGGGREVFDSGEGVEREKHFCRKRRGSIDCRILTLSTIQHNVQKLYMHNISELRMYNVLYNIEGVIEEIHMNLNTFVVQRFINKIISG